MLSACGGGGSDDGYYGSESGTGSNQVPDNDSSKLPDANPGVDSAYPEPKLDVLDASALGFYDHDGRAGEARVTRPDLTGSFQAMIQFGQNHVVDPQGNEAKKMPRLTAEKEALLLVTPTM